jgi:hypothetical protein
VLGDTQYTGSAPINTSNFAPLGTTLAIVPRDFAGFPQNDFYGKKRTYNSNNLTATGAVSY